MSGMVRLRRTARPTPPALRTSVWRSERSDVPGQRATRPPSVPLTNSGLAARPACGASIPPPRHQDETEWNSTGFRSRAARPGAFSPCPSVHRPHTFPLATPPASNPIPHTPRTAPAEAWTRVHRAARERAELCFMATKRMLVDATHPEETRIVVTAGNRLEEFDFESAERRQLRGNI